jgi:acetyl-CoA acyltransferase 1
MGIGPVYAIPLALKNAGLQLSDIDLFEVSRVFSYNFLRLSQLLHQINEAFASQCVYSVKKLGIPS